MEKVDLRFRLSDGGERVEMMTLVDGLPKLQTFWNANDIDGLIRVLSSLRTDMSTSVPSKRPVLNKLRKVAEPSFTVSRSEEDGSVSLSLRHPGFGWIDWSFSKEKLAQMLSGMVSVLKS